MQAAPFSPSRHDGDGVNAEVLRQLELDLPRTAGTDVALHGCIGRVRKMILQHLEDDPELGYCQGMTLVAAVFAAAHNDGEVEAYRRFAAFVQRVRGLWLPGFPLLQPSIASFEALAKGRPWFTHLVRYGVQTEMFLPQALLSMLVTWLPLRTLLHCLQFLESGLKSLLSLAVALLDSQESQLLQQQSFEELMDTIQGLKDCKVCPSRLLETAEAQAKVDVASFPESASVANFRSGRLHRKGSKVVDEEGIEILAAPTGGLPNNLEWLAQQKEDSTSDWWQGSSPINAIGSLFHWIFPDCEAPGKEVAETAESGKESTSHSM